MNQEITILTELFEYLISNNEYLENIKNLLNDNWNINYASNLLAAYYFENIDYLSPNLFIDKIAENLQSSIEETINYCEDNELFS